jgi:hypothetical protein
MSLLHCNRFYKVRKFACENSSGHVDQVASILLALISRDGSQRLIQLFRLSTIFYSVAGRVLRYFFTISFNNSQVAIWIVCLSFIKRNWLLAIPG